MKKFSLFALLGIMTATGCSLISPKSIVRAYCTYTEVGGRTPDQPGTIEEHIINIKTGEWLDYSSNDGSSVEVINGRTANGHWTYDTTSKIVGNQWQGIMSAKDNSSYPATTNRIVIDLKSLRFRSAKESGLGMDYDSYGSGFCKLVPI
jgi:hypothetical protein